MKIYKGYSINATENFDSVFCCTEEFKSISDFLQSESWVIDVIAERLDSDLSDYRYAAEDYLKYLDAETLDKFFAEINENDERGSWYSTINISNCSDIETLHKIEAMQNEYESLKYNLENPVLSNHSAIESEMETLYEKITSLIK